MKTVEFTGPCGCGKTTLLPYLIQAFREQGINALSFEQAMVRSLKNSMGIPGLFFSLLPHAAAAALAAYIFRILQYKYRIKFAETHLEIIHQAIDSQIRRDVSSEHKKTAVKWFLIFGGTYQFFEDNLAQDDVVFFSEGFAHKIVNFFVPENEQPDTDDMTAYLRCVPEIALLVSVSADAKTCAARMQQRGYTPRLVKDDDKTIRRFIENSTTAIKSATRYLEQRGTVVEELDNNKPLAEVSTDLEALACRYASRLKPHLSTPAGNG